MPFPCFWRRSSSYNLRHDFDRVTKTKKSVSVSRSAVLISDGDTVSRRKTVLKTISRSENDISPKNLDFPDQDTETANSRIPGKPVDSYSIEEVGVGDSKNQDALSSLPSKSDQVDSMEEVQMGVSEKQDVQSNLASKLKQHDSLEEVAVENAENQDLNSELNIKSESIDATEEKGVEDFKKQENDSSKVEDSVVDENHQDLENADGSCSKSNSKQEEYVDKTTDVTQKLQEYEYAKDEETTAIENQKDSSDKNESDKVQENISPVTIIIDEVETGKESIYIENNGKENEAKDMRGDSGIALEISSSISRSSSVEYIENEDFKPGGSMSATERYSIESSLSDTIPTEDKGEEFRRRSGVQPTPVRFDDDAVKNFVKYPKSESDENFIKDAIRKNEFLEKVITGRRLQDVVDAMYIKEFKAREKIIKEGQRGGNMYVATEGEFEVTKKGKGVVNVMKPGDVFGELAILYNAKRFASVKSLTASKAWVIDGTLYQQLVKKSNIEEQEEIVSFLQNVPILNAVGLEVLKKVASLLKPEFFETGTTIVKEGDRGDKFYIITAGSVTVTTESNGFMGQLHKGKCFGEKALLEPVTRQATIRADDPGTDCLTLTQKHFVDNFGKVEDISKITTISQPQVPLTDVKNMVNEYSHLDLSEFKILKTLGVGGFGRVEFIQHKKDPSLTFALKCLKKYEMVQQEQQIHVINEMQIQMTCNSPFIIRLYKTFKDNKYIYFLMEVCLGGDLWSLLQRQPNKNFTEKGARFIGGCVLEALAYLHNQGFVYRDLKPENLLIDNNGYVKMTDFGFAKRLTPGVKSGTFAGTPEYLAPEIILNRGHDKAVDLWAYGIFIYELLNGKTPFRSNDPSYMRTYNNILNGIEIVDFPAHNSSKARNLITKLLKKAPSERLGIEEIRTHKWYSGFEWEKLQACAITSPFKPKLSSNVDCKYIDHFRRDNEIPPDENSWWDEYF